MSLRKIVLAVSMIAISSTAIAGKVDPIVAKYLSMGKGQVYAACMWRGVSGHNHANTPFSEEETVRYCDYNCGTSFCK